MAQTMAQTPLQTRASCALVARDLGEPLAGSAARATGWICIEHSGPWTPKAPTAVELGPQATDLNSHPDVRVQLIRTVRLAHASDSITPVAPVSPDALDALNRPTTVLLSHAAVDPADRWTRRLQLDNVAELAHIDPRWTLSATPPPVGEPVYNDVWLLCAHGRRDACCAVYGRPVALALLRAGVEVWETTHTGGHRFAATGIVLPDGLSLGHLDAVDAVAVAAELAAGQLPAALLRGRCAVPGPAQAAEAALRTRLALTGRDDVLPIASEPIAPEMTADATADATGNAPAMTQVHLTAVGARWTATVRSSPVSEPRPISDTAAPTHPTTHEVVELTPA
jgi:hypothetical protein